MAMKIRKQTARTRSNARKAARAAHPRPARQRRGASVERVLVEGIVHDAALAQPGNWYAMFLMPWRHPDGRVIDEQLRVAPDASRGVAMAAQRSYHRGVAVRVTATKVTKGRGATYWNAEGISGVRKVPRLELAEPGHVAFQHALGRLVLDRGRGAFVGKRGRADLVIDRVDRLLATAAERVRAIEGQQATIRAAIAKRLVPVYNTSWREARPAIEAATFDRLLKLSTIHVGDGRTTLYYASGSLFEDHGVQVRIGVRGAISEILIS